MLGAGGGAGGSGGARAARVAKAEIIPQPTSGSSSLDEDSDYHEEEERVPTPPPGLIRRAKTVAAPAKEGAAGGEEEDAELSAYLHRSSRSSQRRATDFSQADHDLRRFLALREQAKRHDSVQDLLAAANEERQREYTHARRTLREGDEAYCLRQLISNGA